MMKTRELLSDAAFGLALILETFYPASLSCALALGIVAANFAFQQYLRFKRDEFSNAVVLKISADLEQLQTDMQEMKNKVSSVSMAAGIRPIPTRK